MQCPVFVGSSLYPPTIDAAGKPYRATIWGRSAGNTTGGVAYKFIP
jgi:hypothetical protein